MFQEAFKPERMPVEPGMKNKTTQTNTGYSQWIATKTVSSTYLLTIQKGGFDRETVTPDIENHKMYRFP